MPDPAGPGVHTLWRAYVSRWAHAPLSGEGADRFGGRWNPVGVPTIYAARELSTAWAEYNQGFTQHPALIVQLELSNAYLADLTHSETLEALGVSASIHQTEWRDALDRGQVPESYYDGVIYPSFMSPGGSCVALWRWNESDEGPRLTVIDPENRLPKSPASWL
jgi:RES domain-containing protein